MHSGIVSPQGVWWKPAGKQERLWVSVAFVWCLLLFAFMPFWHLKGGQNATGVRAKVTPEAYEARVEQFIAQNKVGEEAGFPVVAPQPGAHVYLLARAWEWTPVLRLEAGKTYTLHLSSADYNHGFHLFPMGINLQVVPGYDYALTVTPNQAGVFKVICNEFCGIGHHTMVGKIEVLPAPATGGTQTPNPNAVSLTPNPKGAQ